MSHGAMAPMMMMRHAATAPGPPALPLTSRSRSETMCRRSSAHAATGPKPLAAHSSTRSSKCCRAMLAMVVQVLVEERPAIPGGGEIGEGRESWDGGGTEGGGTAWQGRGRGQEGEEEGRGWRRDGSTTSRATTCRKRNSGRLSCSSRLRPPSFLPRLLSELCPPDQVSLGMLARPCCRVALARCCVTSSKCQG